jgi:hypothetical protein
LFGLPDVGAPAAEARGLEAHRLERDDAYQDHRVGPRELAAVLLLHRPHRVDSPEPPAAPSGRAALPAALLRGPLRANIGLGAQARGEAMILRDSIEVRAAASTFFDFFDGMSQQRYLAWHPDHKVFRWARGQGVRLGHRFYFQEVIAGKLLKKSVEFTRIDPARHIEFAPTFWLMRLFLPRLVFRTEPAGAGAFRFVAEIFLRVGPLGARLNRREFDAVREHMRVEGVNFKRFAERAGASPARRAA